MVTPTSSRTRTRGARSLGIAVVVIGVLGACSPSPQDPWNDIDAPAPSAVGSLGPDFHDLPEGDGVYGGLVVRPRIDSWLGLRPSRNYRVLLIHTTGDEWDAQTQVLVDAMRRWAGEDDHVLLRTEAVDNPHTYPDALEAAATAGNADLVIGAGIELIPAMAMISANFATEQDFLMLGGELPEPTDNATSADWDEYAFSGAMNDPTRPDVNPGMYVDPSSVTPQRAYDALRAGVAAVLGGYSGAVVRVPER